MKIKAIIIASAMMFAFLASGCTDNNSGSGGGSGNSQSSATEDSNPGGDSNETNNGEYENDDGFFNNSDDSSKDGEASGEPSSENSGDADSSESSQSSDMSTADSDATRISLGAEELRSTLIGWGLGKDRDELSRPIDAVKAQRQYGKYSSLFIDASGKNTVCLTFDEGYENGCTADILDTLKKTGVKAAFFVTYDYCVNSPELVERMIKEGHIVGNHTYSHPSLPECTDDEVKEEVMRLHDYVKENFGYEMKYFRFPKGEFSEKTLSLLQSMGYTSVFWSFAYQDWDVDRQPSAAEAAEKVTSATHRGAVFLLHAVSKANADALADIIDYWNTAGYTVETLDDIDLKENA